MITVNWIENKDQIERILYEYKILVKRFPQWFALLIGRIDNQKIRQLLLPNLVDEAGKYQKESSHQDYLNSLMKSLGLENEEFKISNETLKIEHWFFNLFYSGDLYKCLCVLGPATESVSFQFLNPLEEAIKANYPGKNIDYTYFEVHRPDIEIKHAKDLALAMEIYEKIHFGNFSFKELREKNIQEGLIQHQKFWDNLRKVTSKIS
jgi:pyrroloquinoline quinone (PQQ) biosynthesis protein C